jgi:methionine synthase II (cobalamin-independent)
MFVTLLGPLPRPPLPPDAPREALLEAAIQAQETAGLDPVTDAGFGDVGDPIEAWRSASRMTGRTVKQSLLGPYSRARQAADPGVGAADRSDATRRLADSANRLVRDLADAGCAIIEIHEPAAALIGEDAHERALFRDAHQRLLRGDVGSHLSLAITGGSADLAGIDTILAGGIASLAVDLIAGPDNWRLVALTPTTVGIVCGALSPAPGSDDGPETLLWAAGYAASTKSRGSTRVGLATASSFAHLPWDVAIRKLERLRDAARIADLPPSERVQAIDPRAVDSRSAALGRVEPRPSRRLDRDRDPT